MSSDTDGQSVKALAESSAGAPRNEMNQPVQCFVRSAKLNPIRTHLQHIVGASLTYQAKQYGAFEPPSLLTNFDPLECFFVARNQVESDLFIVSDNDVITACPRALKDAIDTMRDLPEIGILGFAYKPCLRVLELSNLFLGEHRFAVGLDLDLRYWEVDHTGTLVVIRTEAMPDNQSDMEQPDFQKGRGDDRLLCYAIRQRGYKVGILPHHHTIHLGEQLSTLWPEGNKAYAQAATT